LIFLNGQHPDIMAVLKKGKQERPVVGEMEVGASFFSGHGCAFWSKKDAASSMSWRTLMAMQMANDYIVVKAQAIEGADELEATT
jgi:hypothetical protein